MNRRGFIGSILGAVAWSKSKLKLHVFPAASAIQPTCEPDALMKYIEARINSAWDDPRWNAVIENVNAPSLHGRLMYELGTADYVPYRGLPRG